MENNQRRHGADQKRAQAIRTRPAWRISHNGGRA
jgi:hypothetical protein